MVDRTEWGKYKTELRKAYFEGQRPVISQEHSTYRDFWAFFDKFAAASRSKGLDDGAHASTSTASFNEHGIPNRHELRFKQRYSFDLEKSQRYMIRNVPEHLVQRFEFILSSYIEFLQREKQNKLRKLEEAQQNLPIAHYRQEILDKLREEQVLVVAGDTGCGKSTQVPQYLLAAGYSNIACTQPRRIACIALSNRVAYETLNEYGSKVAYQIRFERTRTRATRLVFLTEGLLLRQLGTSPTLEQYNVIILDERHLTSDLLMGVLKRLLHDRHDLRLILMSATINVEQFSLYFDRCPIVQVPGRLFPIKTHYRPIPKMKRADEPKGKANNNRIDPKPYIDVLRVVDQKTPQSERGDVLVFLSGIGEITTVADALQTYAEQTKRWIILQLHSTLAIAEQDKVFDVAPDGVRKCILSTNIAETSVTIDGIRFVVDSGLVKEMRYDPEGLTHCLKEGPISKASAEQRKGRAGRTGPGICYRLYEESEYQSWSDYTTTEIHRISLESLVLQMYSLGCCNAENKAADFPFIEHPEPAKLQEALEMLKDQDALSTDEHALTPLGALLSKLPVEVSIGKLLVFGCLFRQVDTILTLAATLSVQAPFTSRSWRDMDAVALRQRMLSSHGDPLTVINVYREWLEVKRDGDNSKRWCVRRGVEEQRLYEMAKLRKQFKEILEDAELIERVDGDATDSSLERRLAHGEQKRLRELKRKAQTERRQTKVLRVDDGKQRVVFDDDADDTAQRDVGEIDFRLGSSADAIARELRAYDLRDAEVVLVKLTVASSLYPRVAMLDPQNVFKQGIDLQVHTKQRGGVVVHPNSAFGQDPEVLCVQTDGQGYSDRHQLLFYSLLLETTKPFVINSTRAPALHAILLCARAIHTNRDCTRMVIDDWLSFECQDASTAQLILFDAVELRAELDAALQRKLGGHSFHSSILARRLMKYTHHYELHYALRRVMLIDQSVLYVGPNRGVAVESLPESIRSKFADAKPNPITGGVSLTAQLTFGSIVEEGKKSSIQTKAKHYLAMNWTCPTCDKLMLVTPVERLEHMERCSEVAELEQKQPTDDVASAMDDPLKRLYYCETCNEKYVFSSVEILRHRKLHK